MAVANRTDRAAEAGGNRPEVEADSHRAGAPDRDSGGADRRRGAWGANRKRHAVAADPRRSAVADREGEGEGAGHRESFVSGRLRGGAAGRAGARRWPGRRRECVPDDQRAAAHGPFVQTGDGRFALFGRAEVHIGIGLADPRRGLGEVDALDRAVLSEQGIDLGVAPRGREIRDPRRSRADVGHGLSLFQPSKSIASSSGRAPKATERRIASAVSLAESPDLELKAARNSAVSEKGFSAVRSRFPCAKICMNQQKTNAKGYFVITPVIHEQWINGEIQQRFLGNNRTIGIRIV